MRVARATPRIHRDVKIRSYQAASAGTGVIVAGTGQNTEDYGSTSPGPEIVRAQLNRVLADPRFTRSERHSRFLRYSVEKTLSGQGEELKEYVIAMEVYGKPASYDPSVDSIVRVDAARLRSKLLDYYTTNGRDDAVRFEFPRGSYAPVFTAQGSPAGPVPPRFQCWKKMSPMPRRWRSGSRLLGCVSTGGPPPW